MTATKKASSKKKPITDDEIISVYMDQVLQHNAEPKNVYQFCQENKIVESDFYAFYGSLEALKQDIWLKFFENVKIQWRRIRIMILILTKTNYLRCIFH
ncbi:hypothetical protein [Flavobacterium piscinae]|uniref:hypothetical protein n=1 Tax=Flavobacterium piscinae TaxID=2506424 RepID=UPI002AAB99A7|nr:hypothetical protein [Flavobacterium piscinae]